MKKNDNKNTTNQKTKNEKSEKINSQEIKIGPTLPTISKRSEEKSKSDINKYSK